MLNSSLRKKRRDSSAYSRYSAEIQSGPGALFKGNIVFGLALNLENFNHFTGIWKRLKVTV